MLYRLVNIHLFVSQAAIFFTADRRNKAGRWGVRSNVCFHALCYAKAQGIKGLETLEHQI